MITPEDTPVKTLPPPGLDGRLLMTPEKRSFIHHFIPPFDLRVVLLWIFIFYGTILSVRGERTNVAVVVTNNMVLTWNWVEQKEVRMAVAGNGRINGENWVDTGSNSTYTAAPTDEYARFDRWEGGYAGTNNPVSLQINNPIQLNAVFVEIVTSNGTPLRWLGEYKLPQNDNLDSDEDMSDNAREYIAGTDPTNKASRFHVSDIRSGRLVIPDSVTGRLYSVESTTNLYEGFTSATNDVPGTGANLEILMRSDNQVQFFLPKVRLGGAP